MTDAPTTVPTAEEIRRELEHTRTAFHELADSLSKEDYKKKTGNSAWSVGQLMWHMAWGAQYVTIGLEAARGKSRPTPPGFIFNWINPWITRLGARGANPESVSKKYDESHAIALKALEDVTEDELGKTIKLPLMDEEVTVAYTLQMPARHFEEHSGDIQKGLGRA